MATASHLKFMYGVVVIGAAAAAAKGFVPLDFRSLESANILNLLLAAIFTALVIERAVEVWALGAFAPREQAIRSREMVIEGQIARKQKALDDENKRPNPDAALLADLREKIGKANAALLVEIERIAPQLQQLKLEKGSKTATLAVLLGLGAAVVGVRVLGQFLPADAATTMDPVQLGLFRFMDVVMTAALLAGGADGIHKLIKPFLDYRSSPG